MSKDMRKLTPEDLKMISGGTYEESLAYAREISGKYGIEIDDDLNGFKELLEVCTDDEHRKMIELYNHK